MSPRMGEQGISALSMSFHKMHGPQGIGLLVIKKSLLARLPAQISGSQNGGKRGGTENLPAIAGAVCAMKITLADRAAKNAKMQRLKNIIVDGLQKEFMPMDFISLRGMSDEDAESKVANSPTSAQKALVVMGSTVDGSPDVSRTNPNTLMVSVINLPKLDSADSVDSVKQSLYKKFCNIKLKSDLAGAGAIVSIGSACQTGEKGASHVLHALGAPFIVRCGVVRISLSDYSTEADARAFVKKFVKAAYLQ